MEIWGPGKYKAENGKIVIIERKINDPVPIWRGYFEGQSEMRATWTEEGKEVSGHKPWDLVGNDETVRWNLQCIPAELDRFVRHRQIEEGKKYLCQQVISDLQDYYRILEAQTGDIIKGEG